MNEWFIIAVMDLFTKWTEAIAVPEAPAKVVNAFLQEEIFARFGTPKMIVSDNGPVFQANSYLRMCRRNNIEAYFTPVAHQRANPIERRVQKIKKTLRALMYNKKQRGNWDKYLPEVLRILRSRLNRATGMTPAKALLGYELPKVGEREIPGNDEERRREQQTYHQRRGIIRQRQLEFNQRHYVEEPDRQRRYNRGDKVLVRETRERRDAFEVKWGGPYEVVEVLSDEVYAVDRNGRQFTFHVDMLRPAPRREGQVGEPGAGDEPEERGQPDDDQVVAEPAGDPNLPGAEPPARELIGRYVRAPSQTADSSSEDETENADPNIARERSRSVSPDIIVHRSDEPVESVRDRAMVEGTYDPDREENVSKALRRRGRTVRLVVRSQTGARSEAGSECVPREGEAAREATGSA